MAAEVIIEYTIYIVDGPGPNGGDFDTTRSLAEATGWAESWRMDGVDARVARREIRVETTYGPWQAIN